MVIFQSKTSFVISTNIMESLLSMSKPFGWQMDKYGRLSTMSSLLLVARESRWIQVGSLMLKLQRHVYGWMPVLEVSSSSNFLVDDPWNIIQSGNRNKSAMSIEHARLTFQCYSERRKLLSGIWCFPRSAE